MDIYSFIEEMIGIKLSKGQKKYIEFLSKYKDAEIKMFRGNNKFPYWYKAYLIAQKVLVKKQRKKGKDSMELEESTDAISRKEVLSVVCNECKTRNFCNKEECVVFNKILSIPKVNPTGHKWIHYY